VSTSRAPRYPDPALTRRKVDKAVNLRLMGLTYQQVADTPLPCPAHAEWIEGNPDGDCTACLPRLYASRTGARRAIMQQLDREYAAGAETRQALRSQQLAQIDLLLTKAMPRALATVDAADIRSVVRLLDRRARLLGLDAPTRVEVTTELDQQITALLDELAEQPPLTV
jgi:hypothetical protein